MLLDDAIAALNERLKAGRHRCQVERMNQRLYLGANTNDTIIATISETKARVKTWAMVKSLKESCEQSDIVLAAVKAIRR